jgi:hypothetical protein
LVAAKQQLVKARAIALDVAPPHAGAGGRTCGSLGRRSPYSAYKADPHGRLRYGLIAAEVAKVYPDHQEAQPRLRMKREAGSLSDGSINLERPKSLNQEDWILVPIMSVETKLPTLPNVGAVDDAVNVLRTLVFAKAAEFYDAPKFAFGLVATRHTDSAAQSYRELEVLLKKFDESGGPSVKLDSVSRQAHIEEFHDGRSWEPKSHEVGVQVPRSVHSERPQKAAVRGIETIPGRSISRIGDAKGKSDRRGAPHAGSYRRHSPP